MEAWETGENREKKRKIRMVFKSNQNKNETNNNKKQNEKQNKKTKQRKKRHYNLM